MTTLIRALALAGAISAFGLPAVADEAPSLEGAVLAPYSAPSGGLLAEIKARGSILDGMEAAVPPFEYVENGQIVGFDVDLAREFATYLGVKLEPVDTAWSGVIPSLYAKKFDMIWSAMSITEARKHAVNFSQVYATDQIVYIARADDSSVKTIADLNGKTMGVQLGSNLVDQIKKIEADNKITVNVKTYDHIDSAYIDLINKNIDLVSGTKIGSVLLLKQSPGKFKTTLEFPISLFQGVATRKEDTDLAQQVDLFITSIRKSGELGKLSVKWFGYQMDLPN
jgi:polar amino acid transport system substrate-binding protein